MKCFTVWKKNLIQKFLLILKNILILNSNQKMSDEPTQICDNCFKPFPESKIATHFGYCRRNIKKCPKCGEMYDINFTEEHEEEFHKLSSCKFCKKSFKPNEINKHEQQCDARTQFCQYCELDVPIKSYPNHLKECESRTKQCEKCRKPIANKDYLIHTISCGGIIEQPKPTEKNSNKFDSYQQYQQAQRKQQPKRNEYLPTYQQPKRQSSKVIVDKRPEQYPRSNLNSNNFSRPTQIKKEVGLSSKPSSQNKPIINYADVNVNKNVINYPSDKRVPNIGQRDNYGRVQIGKNIDSSKNMIPQKSYDNKYQISQQQPGSNYVYDMKKQSSEVPSGIGKINPSMVPGSNTRNYQPSIKYPLQYQIQQPSKDYPKITDKYKREIPSNKEVYIQPQQQRNRQPEQKKQIKNVQYLGKQQQPNYHNFKKEELRKVQQPIRNPSNPQNYQPQQYRTAQQPSSYTHHDPFGGIQAHDEDEQLQKAIMASLGKMNINKGPQNYGYSQKPKYKIDEIPPELLENDMMNESFYGKQQALMDQIQRNKKKR